MSRFLRMFVRKNTQPTWIDEFDAELALAELEAVLRKITPVIPTKPYCECELCAYVREVRFKRGY